MFVQLSTHAAHTTGHSSDTHQQLACCGRPPQPGCRPRPPETVPRRSRRPLPAKSSLEFPSHVTARAGCRAARAGPDPEHSVAAAMGCGRGALVLVVALVAVAGRSAAHPKPVPEDCSLPTATRDNILRYQTKVDKIMQVRSVRSLIISKMTGNRYVISIQLYQYSATRR